MLIILVDELAEHLLDIFKFDPKYLENEERYKQIKAEILGEGSSDEEESGSEESSEEDEEEGEYTCILLLMFSHLTPL